TGTCKYSATAANVTSAAPPVPVAPEGADNPVSLLLGTGEGTFAGEPQVEAGPAPEAVALTDLNADGKADLAVANVGEPGASHVSVLLGAGDGSFGPRTDFPTSGASTGIAVGDLNND